MEEQEIIFSSSYDDRNPPSNIFTSNKKEFFSSTGMFPQEITIQFKTVKNINKINIISYGIKKIKIEICENDAVVNFKKVSEQNDISNSNSLQNISLNLNAGNQIKVLKIIVLEGYEDFFTIHNVSFK
jgi:heat shock protein beta-11